MAACHLICPLEVAVKDPMFPYPFAVKCSIPLRRQSFHTPSQARFPYPFPGKVAIPPRWPSYHTLLVSVNSIENQASSERRKFPYLFHTVSIPWARFRASLAFEGRNQKPGTRYQVPGPRYGAWYQVPGTWYHTLVPGTGYLVPGTWYQGTWCQVTWYRVPGTWCQVPGH